MLWIIFLVYLWIAFYTGRYALLVWKANNKFASVFILVMAVSLIILPIWILFYEL